MKEASTKAVKLLEDDPEPSRRILKWGYTKVIEKPQDKNHDHSRQLFRAYTLADKLCMELLCNLLMDIILEWHRVMYSMAGLLEEVPDSVLKDHLVAQLAWDIYVGHL